MPQRHVRVWLMRGGTSKAVFFMDEDVPEEGPERAAFLRGAMGRDGRQIDGLGGGDPLTSKCVVIDKSVDDRAHLTASFYQVAIGSGRVQPTICGNITPAVGLFAVQQGLAERTTPSTRVGIYVPHVREVVHAEVATAVDASGQTLAAGGDPGTGLRVAVDWSSVVGVESGALTPTGSVTQTVEVPDFGQVTVSVIDCGNPVVLVPAHALGLRGTELPAIVNRQPELLARVEAVRSTVGEVLVERGARALAGNLGHPMLALVSAPTDYETSSGELVHATTYDVASRVIFMQRMHEAHPASAALCVGAAAQIDGTVVNCIIGDAPGTSSGMVRIGHPSGVTGTSVEVRPGPEGYEVAHARYERTARCLIEGMATVDW